MSRQPTGTSDPADSATDARILEPGPYGVVDLAEGSLDAAPDVSWGSQRARALTRHVRPHPGVVRLWRAVYTLLPPFVVALAMAGLAAVRYAVQGYGGHQGLAGFADINRVEGARLGLERYAIASNIGYDGQFFFFLAYRPSFIFTCPRGPALCSTNEPAFRWQRVLYPLTARALALGHPDLLGGALLAVNFLAILVTVALVAQMAVEAGASRWLGACAGLYTGEVLGFLRDLADPFSVMWLVIAVYLFRKQAWRWGALSLAAALLTREALALVVPVLLVPLLFQRRWLVLIESALLAFGPFVAWQAVLKHLYGRWPLIAADPQAAKLARFPFEGLLHVRNTTSDFTLMLIFVGVPMCIGFVIALRAVWQHGPLHLLADPLPAFVVVYLGLVSMTYWFNWADIWAPTRLAAPGLVLALVVVAGLRAPTLRISYAAILALSVLSPLYPMLQPLLTR